MLKLQGVKCWPDDELTAGNPTPHTGALAHHDTLRCCHAAISFARVPLLARTAALPNGCVPLGTSERPEPIRPTRIEEPLPSSVAWILDRLEVVEALLNPCEAAGRHRLVYRLVEPGAAQVGRGVSGVHLLVLLDFGYTETLCVFYGCSSSLGQEIDIP